MLFAAKSSPRMYMSDPEIEIEEADFDVVQSDKLTDTPFFQYFATCTVPLDSYPTI